MRALFTGITGFIGRNLLPLVVRDCPGIEIMTLNRDPERARALFPYPQCQHVPSDDWDSVVAFTPEVVIHLATVSTERNDTAVIAPMLSANIGFGVLLLDALRHCPALRLFVNTGSFAEYGSGPDHFDDAYLYAATKTAFRSFCDYYSRLCGYTFITAVPYTVYGGEPTVKRLMDYVLESMDSADPIDFTAGEQVLDFIHVRDVAGFYIYVLRHLDAFCELDGAGEFHLGTGTGTSIKEMAGMAERVFGKKCNIRWGGRPYRDRDIMHAVAPVGRNAARCGWQAAIPLEEGLALMKGDITLGK